MFENPRRGRQARNFTTNVPKILDLKLSSEQIFSENWRWVPLLPLGKQYVSEGKWELTGQVDFNFFPALCKLMEIVKIAVLVVLKVPVSYLQKAFFFTPCLKTW